MDKLVTILLPIYKEKEEWIKEAIKSVLSQTYTHFELLLLIDNPLFDTSIIPKDKRIRILQNKTNIGLPATLNKGILTAKGAYLARMDADDIMKESRLEKQIKAIKKTDFVFSWVDLIDHEGKKIKSIQPDPNKAKKLQKYIFTENLLLVHPTVMMKTIILKKILYRTKFKRAQDLDLWLRTIKKYSFTILPESLLLYRVPLHASADERITKQYNYSTYGLQVLLKNFTQYWSNIYFYKRMFEYVFYYSVTRLPRSLLKAFMR